MSIILLLICSAGCVERAGIGETQQGQAVKVTLSDLEGDWSLSLGCYWRASGALINSGAQEVSTASVVLSLVSEKTGVIEDSRIISAGPFAGGEARSFSVILDGECGEKYLVQSVVLGD